MGNGTLVGGTADLKINGDVSMASGSMLEGQRGNIQITGSISGSGKIQMDNGYTLTIDKATNIVLDTLNVTGATTLKATNDITINNLTSSGNTINFSGNNLAINKTLTLANSTLNLSGLNNNDHITIATLQLNGDGTITTATRKSLVLNIGTLNSTIPGAYNRKFNATNADIKVTNANSLINIGNLGSLTIKAKSFDYAGTINLNGILTAGGNSTLDFTGVTGKTTIGTLNLTTASVKGSNFTIGTLTAHKGASRSIFYNNIGTSQIDNLNIADNGTSGLDNTILEFQGGGDKLTIGTLKTDKWGVLDASKISELSVDTLIANYSTIKAKKLTIKNATFSNNETYLYADTTDTTGTISLNTGAKLYLKSGQTFTAETLNMSGGSFLYADQKNGGMSGATTINNIVFDGSTIYANNLITKNISVKGAGEVYLSSGSTYTNSGDLNIQNGNSLTIHGGNFTNEGAINITLGNQNPATNFINVADGSFFFNMTKVSTGQIGEFQDGSKIPLLFAQGTTAENAKNPYYASFEHKDANGKLSYLDPSQIDKSQIKSDGKEHYYIEQPGKDGKEGTKYYLQYMDAKGNKIATDSEGLFNANNAKSEHFTTLNGDIKVPKASINVTLNLDALDSKQTYNILTTKNGIEFKDGLDGSITFSKPNDSDYQQYKKELNDRIFFTATDGTPVAITYFISDDNKTISFKYDTGKLYVDVAPFIKPGVWPFGGSAAFGSIGGIPGASGLAKDYTLKLQVQSYVNSVSGKNENTTYYLQNLSYNNYGSTSAKFTIDATGSDFALGVKEKPGGATGVINIGPYNAKSTMVLKANNIYLGGTINLGDGALISGHLVLEATGDITTGDNNTGVININNHSSLKATGKNFTYNGTINLTGNGTVTDEVGMDLSGISGKIHIGTLNARAARPNSVDNNAGIKMKDFSINTMNVYKGNGGTTNNFYSEFTTNIGTSTIGTLKLEAGSSAADQSGLKFSGGGDSLTIDTLDVGSWSFLDASKITDVYINKEFNLPYSTVKFNNLTLNNGTHMNYGGETDLTINGDFTNKYGTMDINASGGIQTITVKGNAHFYFSDKDTPSSGIATPLIKISEIKGLKLNQKYTLLKIDGSGQIVYYYTDSAGKEINSKDNKDNANALYSDMADRITLYNSDGSINDGVEKNVNDREISIVVNESDATNPYDPNDIRYWFYKKGGKHWVDHIGDVGMGVMDWLQVLMIDKHNGLWAKDKVFSNDLHYFTRIATQLESTMGQLSSVKRKNNSTAATRLATDVNKMSRLVKLSSTQSNAPTFADMLRSLENKHFAVAGGKNARGGMATIYKYANRNTYRNNIWATAIGTASFVEGGNSTLYGINAGYDRFVKNVIIGGYLAYARGNYNGDIIRNQSQNVNAGFYSRAYVGNNEFDVSASETIGFNKEEISSQDAILSQLNQNYRYNTYTTNVNVNYGYVFGLSEKSVVIKPQVGLSYYYIAATKILGNMVNPEDNDLRVDANPDQKQNIALNLAIETRQYFNNASYWYFIAGVSRDLFLKSKGDQEVRFVGNNTLSYKKGDLHNTYASLTAGGEMELFRRIYVNLGLGAKAGLAYKDINISGNVGMRYVF
ncbi:vacuolating cyotoxin family protein [Helicobacter sp. 11S02596-1]|uniref:vacuolating cyotoxin family protein n=1 Tax=Helicobacter sp. 11S02596-1 TaxID=1476194 RepID=UPI0015DDCC7C|nr:vacuolating cyotoxin family protein [Helicobacter sp. 11S02596-1]